MGRRPKMLHFNKWQYIAMENKYKHITAKELYKMLSTFTVNQITDIIDVLTCFSDISDEKPLRVLPISDLEDYLEVNGFIYNEDNEAAQVMEESKQYNEFGYFSFDWSNGFIFYNNLEEYSKTLINYFSEFFNTLYNTIDLLEVYEVIETCYQENTHTNYITFGTAWKKYCNYKPFRQLLQ